MSKNGDEQMVLPCAEAASKRTFDAPPEYASISKPPSDVPVVNDEGLAKEFRRLEQEQGTVLVIANAYTVCVRHRVAPNDPWQMICCGELGAAALEAAKPLRPRKRLLWGRVEGAPWDTDPGIVLKVEGTVRLLKEWLKASDGRGREGDVTLAIKEELTSWLAGAASSLAAGATSSVMAPPVVTAGSAISRTSSQLPRTAHAATRWSRNGSRPI